MFVLQSWCNAADVAFAGRFVRSLISVFRVRQRPSASKRCSTLRFDLQSIVRSSDLETPSCENAQEDRQDPKAAKRKSCEILAPRPGPAPRLATYCPTLSSPLSPSRE